MAARRDTYNVEAILVHAGFTLATRKFLVNWEGYSHDDNTFEPFEHVKDCLAFQQYWPNKLDHTSVKIVSHEGNERNIYSMTFHVEWLVFRYEPNGDKWEYFIHTQEPYENVVGQERALAGIREPDYRECATCQLWLPPSHFRDERVLRRDRRRGLRQTIHCVSCNPMRQDHLAGFIVYDDGSDWRGVDYQTDPEWLPAP